MTCYENIAGAASAIPSEVRMLSAFAPPALEAFRKKLLAAASSTANPHAQARAVVVLAHRSELRNLFVDVLPLTPVVLDVKLCTAEKLIDIRGAVNALETQYAKAVQELQENGLPVVYTPVLLSNLRSASYVNQVTAAAAVVLIASTLLS